MPDNGSDWVKIPPKDIAETPQQIREQRDLYRAWHDRMLIEEWGDAKPEDWNSPDGCRAEIDAIIAELDAEIGDV